MIPLGIVFGISLKMHVAFPVLMATALWLGQGRALLSMLLALSLHEAVHAVAARAFGQRFESIELMPFGGVAQMGSVFSLRPLQELTIAISGPIASLLLSLLTAVSGLKGPLVQDFLRMNLSLAVVNLIPALPLDGGRVFRALLTGRLGRARATRLFALGGVVFGVLIVLLGVWVAAQGVLNPFFFLTGVYLIYAALKEKETLTAALFEALHGRQARLHREGVLPIRWLAVDRTVPPEKLIARLTAGTYHLFTMVDEDLRRVETLDEGALLKQALESSLGDATKS